MNTPAASAAISLRQSNPSLMRLFQYARSAGAKCKKYFQMLVWFLKAEASIRLILVKILPQKIQSKLINPRDVAGDFLKVRDRDRSLLSSYQLDQLHPWSLLARCWDRSFNLQPFLNTI